MRTDRFALTLLLFVLLGSVFTLQVWPANARPAYQAQTGICYVAADNEDTPSEEDSFAIVDFQTGVETFVGKTGTRNIEAIAIQASTGRVFAADGGQLGTIDLATGDFTKTAVAAGTANGELGAVLLRDIDGLAFDAATGYLYGSNRRAVNDNDDDVLFRLNPDTGAYVDNAFGDNLDYVVVVSINSFHDVDDIAIDPVNGQMYAILNDGGVGDHLVMVDKFTGAVTDIGEMGIDDMEGLAFDPTGQLLGTTGKSGGDYSNMLFHIDKLTGIADTTTAKKLTSSTDYEAVDCLTEWLPTPTPTATATATFTATPTATATSTATATPTATTTPPIPPGITPTPTPTPTMTPPPDPSAVELLYFRVENVDGLNVTLSWATAAEIGNVGFWIYRGASPDFASSERIKFLSVSEEVSGKTYHFTDTAPGLGDWWYWLADVDNRNIETLHTPVKVDLSGRAPLQDRIYLPLLMVKP